MKCVFIQEVCPLHPSGIEPICFEECGRAIQFLQDFDLYTSEPSNWLITVNYLENILKEIKHKDSLGTKRFLRNCFKYVIKYLRKERPWI